MSNVIDLVSRRAAMHPLPERIAGLIQRRASDIVLLGTLALDADEAVALGFALLKAANEIRPIDPPTDSA